MNFSAFAAEMWIFVWNWIDTMTSNVLAAGVARTSEITVLFENNSGPEGLLNLLWNSDAIWLRRFRSTCPGSIKPLPEPLMTYTLMAYTCSQYRLMITIIKILNTCLRPLCSLPWCNTCICRVYIWMLEYACDRKRFSCRIGRIRFL